MIRRGFFLTISFFHHHWANSVFFLMMLKLKFPFPHARLCLIDSCDLSWAVHSISTTSANQLRDHLLSIFVLWWAVIIHSKKSKMKNASLHLTDQNERARGMKSCILQSDNPSSQMLKHFSFILKPKAFRRFFSWESFKSNLWSISISHISKYSQMLKLKCGAQRYAWGTMGEESLVRNRRSKPV